ncbi:MAG: hypothetical protein AVDCRST_MAG85-981, partial [uncultured Solirubrobacteraceae bacterium]
EHRRVPVRAQRAGDRRPGGGMARRPRAAGRRGADARRRAHLHERGRRAVPRPRQRRRGLPARRRRGRGRAHRARRLVARVADRRDVAPGPRAHAGGAARALDPRPARRRRVRARLLLRHLPRLPQPQGRHPDAPARRAVRPRAARGRPGALLRQRPRDAAALGARHRRRRARAVRDLRGVHRLPSAVAGRRPRVRPGPADDALLRDGDVGQLGARGRELLRLARARPGLRLQRAVLRPARLRGHAPAADPARRPHRVAARPDERDPAGDRGVRVAAHRDELHRAARGAHARPEPPAEDRAVGVDDHHGDRDDLPRLALRRRRRRRADHRSGCAVAREAADGLRRAGRPGASAPGARRRRSRV